VTDEKKIENEFGFGDDVDVEPVPPEEAMRRYHLRRAMLLAPSEHARVVAYNFGLSAKKGDGELFTMASQPNVVFRAKRMLTNVQQPDAVTLTSLTVGHAEQLLGPVDLYRFGLHYCEKIDREFLEQNGLAGKSHDEVDAWLDEHDMQMPSAAATRVDLPTVDVTKVVRLSGSFSPDVLKGFLLTVSFIGMARE
jgi:hypothetical protein